MTGIYIVADLSVLNEVASHFAAAASDNGAPHEIAAFDHPEADAAAAEFSRAAQSHSQRMSDTGHRAAEVMRGYAVGFHQVGD